MDKKEAMGQGLTTAGEFAEYFGVPVEMVTKHRLPEVRYMA